MRVGGATAHPTASRRPTDQRNEGSISSGTVALLGRNMHVGGGRASACVKYAL